MTVAQLIAKLMECPDDSKVFFHSDFEDHHFPIEEVTHYADGEVWLS